MARVPTDTIDAWLEDNYMNATIRDAAVSLGVSDETILRHEKALGITCVRHTLKRSSQATVIQTPACLKALRSVWAPPFDYAEE